ncbi:MAG: hypothetical protein OEZ43_00500 [Gammaproteobacteria bacterium]|nr:hypothetical protein [Gammaproteobacteria bacterium]
MKKLLALKLFLLLIVSSSSALAWSPEASKASPNKNEWTHWDSAMEVAYFMTHVADWGQTRSISGQCKTGAYREMNPILGECPSLISVNAYFIGTALLHAGVAYALPPKYRRLFQSTTIVTQIGVVSSNASIGLDISF